MLDLFENAGGDIGAYLGGRALASICTSLNARYGAQASAFAGVVGYVGGSVIGRSVGEYYGRELFYNLAKPGYEQYIASKRVNSFVLDYNDYIYFHYPIAYPY